MSKQRKRLTDDEWGRTWGGVMPDRLPRGLVALRDDHHQAREDRKRLASMVRALAAALKALDGDKWGENGLITDALSLVAETDPQ